MILRHLLFIILFVVCQPAISFPLVSRRKSPAARTTRYSVAAPPINERTEDDAIRISATTTAQRRNKGIEKLFSKLTIPSIKKIVVLGIIAAVLVATKSFTSGTAVSLLPPMIYNQLKYWKRVILVYVAAWQCVFFWQVKQRQALDATSEWGRYARNPGARGRALMALAVWVAMGGYVRARVWQRIIIYINE